MQIIFDKGTENQRAIAIDFFGENLFRGNLNASWNRQLGAEELLRAGAGQLQRHSGRQRRV